MSFPTPSPSIRHWVEELNGSKLSHPNKIVTYKMKRTALILLTAAFCLQASSQVMKQDAEQVTTINTTSLSDEVWGYAGPVPVKIKIDKNDKIQSVVLLTNDETPGYIRKVQKMFLPRYKGMKVKDCLKRQPDVVTGATVTVNAIKENVRRGLEYYQKNKEK